MADVYDVADFFVDWADKSGEAMTNLRLNALMYFAQGQSLGRRGVPLFDAPVEAWPPGPVVPCVYLKYRVCGKSPITTISDDFSERKFTREEQLFLVDVLREYGIFSAGRLASLSHGVRSPWSEVYVEGRRKEIPRAAMQKFFSQPEHRLRSFDMEAAIRSMEAIPTGTDGQGNLVIPRDEGEEDDEWDDL